MSNSLTQLALKKFKTNRSGLFSFTFISLIGIIAVFAYVLAPDDSENANQMHLEIHSKKPGFTVQMLTIPSDEQKDDSFFKSMFFGKQNAATEIPISDYKISTTNLEITPYAEGNITKQKMSYDRSLFPGNPEAYIKTKKFVLGTDKYGRDLLSRMLIGAR
ncbi:MAG: ABC transporter permease, partial [Flavobacteriaceae bacterium]|nr:ABC transporter permease [Flavobacteriaceae bacterium]